MAQAYSTIAKDVASYFYQKTGIRGTPAMYAKTIKQAKSLLEAGYTEEEIIYCLDFVIDIKKIDIYSLGYLSYTIANIIKEVRATNSQKVASEVKQKMDNMSKEVLGDNEGLERNKQKAQNIGVKSRFGEKFTFDMPTKTRQDN